MGILGLTHTSDGQAVQRLPVVVKLAIGRPPDPKKGRNHPEKTDHFIFQTRSTSVDTGWDEDAELTKQMAGLYGDNPRELEITFLDDEIDNALRTELAWWTASECKCSGKLVHIEDGSFAMRAIRRTDRAPQGEQWPGTYKYGEKAGDKKGKPVEPCGDGCPDLEGGVCKPSADLYFIPYKLPALGVTWKLHTTSYNSIRNLSSALQQVRRVTGGRLAGIPLRLCVAPQKVGYRDDTGKAKKSNAHILSIVFRAEDLQRLMSSAGEYAQLYQQSRKELGPAKVLIVEDDESQAAAAIAPEFYHDESAQNGSEGAGSMAAPKANIPPAEEVGVRNEIADLCRQMGINRAGEMSLLGQFQGRLGELATKLKADLASKSEGATGQRETVSDRAASQPQTTGQGPQTHSAPQASAFDF